MSSRLVHRMKLFSDRDVLHTLIVAGAACVLSAGLVYVGYFLHVLRVARKAPCLPERGECLLLFGKHAPHGRIDADFALRLERATLLWQQRPPRSLVLLGGGPDGMPTEAETARQALFARGIAADAPLRLEARSRDTLQNLRNARELLRLSTSAESMSADSTGGDSTADDAAAGAPFGRVTLLSNRYHLARCALFADQLGLDWELCAAEAQLPMHIRTVWRIAGEAAYVCWSDIGTRWARLIGHRRMLARVT